MEQNRLREEAQIRSEHAKHLKIMRQKLEAEKKQRHERCSAFFVLDR